MGNLYHFANNPGGVVDYWLFCEKIRTTILFRRIPAHLCGLTLRDYQYPAL